MKKTAKKKVLTKSETALLRRLRKHNVLVQNIYLTESERLGQPIAYTAVVPMFRILEALKETK